MIESLRFRIFGTVGMAAVYAASAWWAGGLTGDGIFLEMALVAANTLPLLLLAWNPVAVVLFFAMAFPAWVITGHEAHILQSLPSLAALYAAGAWSRPLWVRALALLSPLFMFVSAVSGWWGDVDPLEIGYVAIVFFVVWALGVLMTARREHVAELEEKTARLERAERRLADRAVAEERSRIARELHDVVAHAMSLITVQAGVGAHLIDRDPDQAGQALRTIEQTGRQAMDEMRRMLDVLQGVGGGEWAGGPQPGLSDVEALATQMGSAGVRVELEMSGDIDVPPGLDLAAYRVVQEALTNVVKHAPGRFAQVMIAGHHDRLEVEVWNAGVDGDFEPGQGLRGMAERVALYDGELVAGPAEEGFRIHAVFPVGGRG